MGKIRLEHLRGKAPQLIFLAASVILVKLPAMLPANWLAYACLGGSWAVKLIGLPAQIRKLRREKSATGVSLLRNALDYESYVLWWLYGLSIHNNVIAYGQAPGAVMVWGIIWYNLKHGSFPWRPLPNSTGHYHRRDCQACSILGELTSLRLAHSPFAQWAIRTPLGLPRREFVAHLVECPDPDCNRGLLHLMCVWNRPWMSEDCTATAANLTLKIECDTCCYCELRDIDFPVVKLSYKTIPVPTRTW